MTRKALKKKLCIFLLLQLDEVEDQAIPLNDVLWEFNIDEEEDVLILLEELENQDDVLQRDKNTGLIKITNVAGLTDLASKK
ncbi:MAG TPA: hypothetical protein PKZ16_00975 [bacterium]|nr:hypothetical protein [bacterium]HPL95456.1 hypothetical protein [bacterium]